MRPNLGQLSSHSDSKRSTTISTRLPSQNNNRRRRMPENVGNCRNDASHRECGVTWQLNRRQCPISELRTVPITNPDSLLIHVGEDDESHFQDDAIMRLRLMKRCEMRQNNEGSAWELNERPFSYAYCAFHWSHDAIHCMSKIMMRMNIVKSTSHSSWEFKAIGHFLC